MLRIGNKDITCTYVCDYFHVAVLAVEWFFVIIAITLCRACTAGRRK